MGKGKATPTKQRQGVRAVRKKNGLASRCEGFNVLIVK